VGWAGGGGSYLRHSRRGRGRGQRRRCVVGSAVQCGCQSAFREGACFRLPGCEPLQDGGLTSGARRNGRKDGLRCRFGRRPLAGGGVGPTPSTTWALVRGPFFAGCCLRRARRWRCDGDGQMLSDLSAACARCAVSQRPAYTYQPPARTRPCVWQSCCCRQALDRA
jgi:hypothetical protein